MANPRPCKICGAIHERKSMQTCSDYCRARLQSYAPKPPKPARRVGRDLERKKLKLAEWKAANREHCRAYEKHLRTAGLAWDQLHPDLKRQRNREWLRTPNGRKLKKRQQKSYIARYPEKELKRQRVKGRRDRARYSDAIAQMAMENLHE